MDTNTTKIIKDLAKQSYELEGQGGLVHSTGHEALTSWLREAGDSGDTELVDTLEGLDRDEWAEACLVYEDKYSALKHGAQQVVIDR